MRLSNLLLFITSIVAFACSTGKYSDLPLEKRYWTPDDYEDVVLELLFPTNKDEKLPTLDDPETRIIVEKLIDEENFKVILDDEELGVKYRNEIGEDYFREWRKMNDIYTQLDRQDKFIYPLEYVECFKFGLGLQLRYFKLGNLAIKENSIDPDASNVKSAVNKNIRTMIGNFNIYLDLIKNEDSFNEKALVSYANGIDKYFSQLIAEYPNANYKGTKQKLNLLKEKFETNEILVSIDNILKQLSSVETPS